MTFFRIIWNNFKAQPDVWFFCGFLLTFTLSIRKVIKFYPLAGGFNEYAGIYLYLSDIFSLLTILAFCFIIIINLRNKTKLSSSFVLFFALFKPLIKLLLIFNLWVFISIFWSNNPILALFRAVKILEFSLLFLYIAMRIVPCGTILKQVFQIAILLGVFQAIIGIWQFFIQQSIGLFWLKESLISPNINGVAKVIFDGEKYIRAYGLFPHPNVFGGFLVFSIILTFMYKKMFHPSTNVPRGTFCGAGVEHFAWQAWNILRGRRGIFQLLSSFHKGSVGEGFLWITLIIQFIALLLTFSKSAILGLIIALLYIFVPHGTKILNIIKQLFHVEQLYLKLILLIGIILVLAYIIKPDINSLLFKSLDERALYAGASYGIISAHPLIGLGSGQFVINIDNYVPYGAFIELWQYQPVHNVFLLIWSELGIIGLSLFLWWIWRLFHPKRREIVPRGTISSYEAGVAQNTNQQDVSRLSREARMFHVEHSIFHWDGTIMLNQQLSRILKGLLLGFLFIMLFDHYFWDIQQGQIMLWLILGIIAGIASYNNIDEMN